MKDRKKEKKKAAGIKEKEEKQKKAARKQKKHKKETSGEQRERKEIKEKVKQAETPAPPESRTEKTVFRMKIKGEDREESRRRGGPGLRYSECWEMKTEFRFWSFSGKKTGAALNFWDLLRSPSLPFLIT